MLQNEITWIMNYEKKEQKNKPLRLIYKAHTVQPDNRRFRCNNVI